MSSMIYEIEFYSNKIELIIKRARERWQDYAPFQIHTISQNSDSFSKNLPHPLKELIIWVYQMEEFMFYSDKEDQGAQMYIHTYTHTNTCLMITSTDITLHKIIK